MKKRFLTITIFLIFLGLVGISFVYYYLHKQEITNYSQFLKQKIITEQKIQATERVNSVINIIKVLEKNKIFNDTLLRNIVDNISFKNYIFVIKIVDLNKENFGIMIANPNRKDIEGKFLNKNFKDAKGEQFRKKFTAKIKKFGQGFVSYYYTKPSGGISEKITLFKRYKNYIVASGFYIDDVNKKVKEYISPLEDIILSEIIYLLIAAFFVTSGIIFFLTTQLEKLIQEIENETIQKEIKKHQKLSNLQIKETINNIAHKFRQPLNVINIKLMRTGMLLDSNKIKEAKENLLSIEEDIIRLSNEIENFKDIAYDSNKNTLNIKKSIQDILELVEKDVLKIDICIEGEGEWNFSEKEFKKFFFNMFILLLKNSSKLDIKIEDDKITIINYNQTPKIETIKYLQTLFESIGGKLEYEIKEDKSIFTLKPIKNPKSR